MARRSARSSRRCPISIPPRTGDSRRSPTTRRCGCSGCSGRNVPLPPSAVRPALVVTPIAGAPGNGAVALGRAMTKALEWRGATLALEPGENTLLVLGSVALSDAAAGSQLVEITWEVIRPDGARLGVVSQKNTVPEGSLDGKWGTIAAAIASSAAQGVVDLLDRTIPR